MGRIDKEVQPFVYVNVREWYGIDIDGVIAISFEDYDARMVEDAVRLASQELA